MGASRLKPQLLHRRLPAVIATTTAGGANRSGTRTAGLLRDGRTRPPALALPASASCESPNETDPGSRMAQLLNEEMECLVVHAQNLDTSSVAQCLDRGLKGRLPFPWVAF